MKGRKSYCTLVLTMLCFMIVNSFLPLASNGDRTINLCNAFCFDPKEYNAIIVFAVLLIYIFPLLIGIINCILFLCNVCKHYKYALCSILVPFIINFIMIFILFNNGHYMKLSTGVIIGPILSIVSLLIVYIENKREEKNIEKNISTNSSNLK